MTLAGPLTLLSTLQEPVIWEKIYKIKLRSASDTSKCVPCLGQQELLYISNKNVCVLSLEVLGGIRIISNIMLQV